MNTKKTAILTSRIDHHLKDQFVSKAHEAGLTPSSLNEILIQKWIDNEQEEKESDMDLENLLEQTDLSSIPATVLVAAVEEKREKIKSNRERIFQEVLSKMFTDGIRTTTDDQLQANGLKRSWLPYLGTHVYGDFKLISQSFWNESWTIEKA